MAQRLIRQVSGDDVARVQHAYHLLFGRAPTQEEMKIAQHILGTQPSEDTWTDLAHVLLCSNEFVYVD